MDAHDSGRASPLTPPAEWKVAGTSLPKVNGRDIVTGAHKYTYDMKRPGMLHGKVLYPPQFGATLVSLDAAAAEAMPGVKVVHDGNFVAVAAPEPDTAAKALAALKASGSRVTAEADSHSVFQYFKQTAQRRAPTAANLDALHTSPTSRTCRWSRARRSPSGRATSSRSGPARSGPSACAANWRRPSESPRTTCA